MDFKRSSAAGVSASARVTNTFCVFDARISHQPSGVMTRAPSMSFTLMEGSTPGLSVDKENGNLVTEGEGKFDTKEVEQMQRVGLSKSLRVERFLTTEDVVLVQVDMNKDMQINLPAASYNSAANLILHPTDSPAVAMPNM